MPDYTEEDVERAARAVQTVRNGLCQAYASNPEADLDFMIARALMDAIWPEAFTAGALAMKEAAENALANEADEQTSSASARWMLRQAAKLVSALPVPPRGSKI